MASLNLSINGPSIKSSYQGVINAPAAPSGSSSTYGQWALFYVQAPLANAFQESGSKESVLKVQSTGSGELEELFEDFNEGRIQFAFLKVKDPNTALPKYALIAWCGGGVPERTKGYFTSHLNAVSKILHGYHVQITARSETDLEPANILQKIADASGAKYTAGGGAPIKTGGAPPPVKSKPVFASASGSSSFNPIVAARNASLRKADDDGWGDDAPQVTRTEIQKVESAYKPTKVNMAELISQKQEPSRFNGSSKEDDRPRDVIGGGYQPVGKIDIAAIRAAAKEKHDDRPTPVKGAYEPVGKVDIAAIRARSQKPADTEATPEADEPPKSLVERSAAFNQAERITELPKPKVAKKWSGAAAFTGTKAPTPGALGFGGPSPAPGAPPVGSASRTFADQGGKTPAQLWAEKKAQQGGASSVSKPITSPITAQQSGGTGWQSGYTGKSWAPVQTGSYSRGIPGQKTGETETSQEAPTSPGASVGALRDRFKDAAPIAPTPSSPPASRALIPAEENGRAPPPPPAGTRPSDSAPTGGFALPGMPPRPPPAAEEEEEPEQPPSPVRVAIPVPRGPEPEIEPAQEPPRSLPVRPIEQELPRELPEERESVDTRAVAAAVAETQFGHEPAVETAAASSGGKRALIQYDYEKAEDNELELREGEYVTNIEMVDEDWWMGTNARGESGLFPSNYVELVDDDAEEVAPAPAATHAAVPPPSAPAAEPEPVPATGGGHTATAQFDYEAAEDNELSFPEGAKVTNLEFPDDDWWFGHYKGDTGLFPANYVQLDQ
ncbi:actin binding protein [Parahypoxylon ruwenzoriense]